MRRNLALLVGIAALMLAFVFSFPAAVITLARRGRQATMPYGPFLALGAAVVLLTA